MRWLLGVVAIAVLIALAVLLTRGPTGRGNVCRWICDGGICPPCPGDPPEETLAPVLVREPAED